MLGDDRGDIEEDDDIITQTHSCKRYLVNVYTPKHFCTVLYIAGKNLNDICLCCSSACLDLLTLQFILFFLSVL